MDDEHHANNQFVMTQSYDRAIDFGDAAAIHEPLHAPRVAKSNVAPPRTPLYPHAQYEAEHLLITADTERDRDSDRDYTEGAVLDYDYCTHPVPNTNFCKHPVTDTEQTRQPSPATLSESAAMTRPLALLVTLCILLLIACAALLAALAYVLTQGTNKQLCLTEDCIRTASTLLTSMDQSVDPCDDFYMYACGQWIDENPIPDSSSSVSNFDNLNKNLESSLMNLLDAPITDSDGTAVKKTKEFYQLCMDEGSLAKNWPQTITSIMNDDFGGWPTLDRAWRETISLEKLYARMAHRYQADFLFKVNVQPDDKNSSVHILLLDSPSLNLFGRDFYLMDRLISERTAYTELITEVLTQMNVTVDEAKRDAQDILRFEIELANSSVADERRHDMTVLYQKITLNDLRQNYRYFNWNMFLEDLYKNVPHDDADGKPRFVPETEIVVYGVDFLKNFDQLMADSQFSMRTKTNYLCWCWFFKSVLRDLPDPYAMILFNFYRKLNMMSAPAQRWHGCVKRINSLMPAATGRVYVQEHFNEQAKHKVEEMIDHIMREVQNTLEEEDWLSDETKMVADEKIRAMERKIGFPEFLNDVEKVDELYEEYKVVKTDYFITKFNFYDKQRTEVLNRFGKKVDRNKWVSGAAVVNAFYSPNTNEIIFPAGILQPVFYDEKFPWSMNFGGIGVVIGHEIIHGFDDRGRLYDKIGNIRQWWDNNTIEAFNEKAQCIEDQYSGYMFEQVNMTIDGKRTKGENIADNGGLKHAFKAYQQWQTKYPETKQLPGLELTHDQLFFINYAQIWCGHMNDKEAMRKIRTSEHCPGYIRVKGPLSNSEEFAKAFSCPVNSRMNPEPSKKCSVW